MPAKELAVTWQMLGHKILSSILVDNAAVFPVMDVLGRDVVWFPGKQAQVYQGIIQCVDENTPPTIEAVTIRGQFPNGYVQSIANQWNDDDNRKVVYHCEEIRKLGTLAELRRIGREMQQVTSPDQVEAHIDYIGNRLVGLSSLTSNRQGDAQTVSDSAWSAVDKFGGVCIPTGLSWFDDVAGGLWPGMNYWIVAAYKMGKSTLMRNCILSALDNDFPVDAYCAEGSREMFALDCQAMIATRLLCEWGERNLDHLRLSGLFLLRFWRSNKPLFTKAEYEATQQAREIWNSYPVRVWDTSDGIRGLSTFRYRVQKSRMMHNSQTHWADYSQLFGNSGTTYERQSKTAKVVQEIATSENVAVCMLAQRNEESIKYGESYSAGVKGGGDASAAADFMIVPHIDHELDNRMYVKIKHSRHTGTGNGTHIINRTSGLILDRWFA
jgi:hypothetical protein